jgi:hypothetical protein
MSYGMLRLVALVRTYAPCGSCGADISDEFAASIIRVT